MHRSAVILAGGSGTRLWPLSREDRPKQLLRLFDGRSLLYRAFERLQGLFTPEDVYVIALARHLPAVAEELPMLPAGNLIGEPVGQDTASAIATAAAILHRRNPETVLGVFTADHLIRPVDKFVETIRIGLEAAEADPEALVTYGVRPTSAHTGLGYVQRGEHRGPGLWTVKSFREKPDASTAGRYLASGEHYWNSGMFAWRTKAILDQLRRHLPETHAAAERLSNAFGTAQWPAVAGEVYPTLRKISIDYAVLEKASNVLMVEMDLDWLDVGSWTSLPSVLGRDESGNCIAAAHSASLDSRGNILVSEGDHLIAAVGVENLVVVHSGDVTLVCHKEQVQRIKELIPFLGGRYDRRYD